MELKYNIVPAVTSNKVKVLIETLEGLKKLEDIRVTGTRTNRFLLFTAPDDLTNDDILSLGVLIGITLIRAPQ